MNLQIKNKKLDGIISLEDKSNLIVASFITSNILGNRIKIEKTSDRTINLNKSLINLFLLITVKGGKINLETMEEFLPLFLTTASFAVAKTTFVGVDVASKISVDTINVLKQLGALIEVEEDLVMVDGRGIVKGTAVDCTGLDNGIIFALIVAGTVSYGEIILENVIESAELKEFLQIFESLGGEVNF